MIGDLSVPCTCRQYTTESLQAQADSKCVFFRSIITRIDELCTFRDDDERHRIISGLRWMGLFSDDLVDEPKETPIDTLCGRLEKIMSFREGEQDLVMLQHTFVVEWPAPPAQGESGTGNGNNNGGNTETFTSTLALKGEPGPQGYSAMSKSVGVTCGVATQLLLDSHPAFTRPGLLAPYVPEICTPIRLLVEKEGISMVEEKIGSTFS